MVLIIVLEASLRFLNKVLRYLKLNTYLLYNQGSIKREELNFIG